MNLKVAIILITLFYLQANSFAQRSNDRAFELADSIYHVLVKQPNQFCDLVLQFSEDPASKDRCGVYDYERPDKFVEPIQKVIEKKKNINKILAPIRSEFGYHIVQLLDIRGTKAKFRHILIQVGVTGKIEQN
ncbi:MAG: peptidylprolyl isomerase [Crocinitomicaceae bacterium]|nr:peptidylprolyl isomerase [Crocinitomicaceae bacterium]MBK9591387.1 peptidylprolyl isomerase [Crocinitomicaceae bacterium]